MQLTWVGSSARRMTIGHASHHSAILTMSVDIVGEDRTIRFCSAILEITARVLKWLKRYRVMNECHFPKFPEILIQLFSMDNWFDNSNQKKLSGYDMNVRVVGVRKRGNEGTIQCMCRGFGAVQQLPATVNFVRYHLGTVTVIVKVHNLNLSIKYWWSMLDGPKCSWLHFFKSGSASLKSKSIDFVYWLQPECQRTR